MRGLLVLPWKDIKIGGRYPPSPLTHSGGTIGSGNLQKPCNAEKSKHKAVLIHDEKFQWESPILEPIHDGEGSGVQPDERIN